MTHEISSNGGYCKGCSMSSGGGRVSSSCMALLVKLSMSCMFRPTVLDDVSCKNNKSI